MRPPLRGEKRKETTQKRQFKKSPRVVRQAPLNRRKNGAVERVLRAERKCRILG